MAFSGVVLDNLGFFSCYCDSGAAFLGEMASSSSGGRELGGDSRPWYKVTKRLKQKFLILRSTLNLF